MTPSGGLTDAEIFHQAITEERSRQDRTHGGPEHDDTQHRRDWITLICREASMADRQTCGGFGQQMVRVAALAQAAYESIRRQPR
jgi:hypothetical protein